jgi:hypothetical protein
MDIAYSRVSRRSGRIEHFLERLLCIGIVFTASVSLAGAGGRGEAEVRSGFAQRSSTLSGFGGGYRGYLDQRTGHPHNGVGLAASVSSAVGNPDHPVLNRIGPMRTVENRVAAPKTPESASNAPLGSNFQDERMRATWSSRRANNAVMGPLSTSQATNEAQNRINERFGEYAKRIADNPRLSFAEKERQSRLDRCRTFLVNLIYVGYAPDLVYSWTDDLLNDEVVDGMPTDLVDLYWGVPIYTQVFVEYYVPYENRYYRTPAGDYRQVTFANNVVVKSHAASGEPGW